MKAVAALLLVPVMLTACTDGQAEPTEQVQTAYLVRYDAATYDRGQAEKSLQRCVALPGATLGDQASSLPPINSVLFEGSAPEQAAVEDCLTGIPSGEVTDRDSGRAIGP